MALHIQVSVLLHPFIYCFGSTVFPKRISEQVIECRSFPCGYMKYLKYCVYPTIN